MHYALIHGTAAEIAGALGLRPLVPGNLITAAPYSGFEASDFRDTICERLPPLCVVSEGKVLGEYSFPPYRSGEWRCRGIGRAFGRGLDSRPEMWLTAVLKDIEHYVRRVGTVSTLLIRPAAAAGDRLVAALAAAGYVDAKAGTFKLDLIAEYWRRGGVFVIAEAGSNWRMGSPERDLAMAQALINVAVEAGADAVKFQTFRPETVYVAEAGASDYLADAGIKQSIRDIFADIAMPYDMLPKLADYARSRGIEFMSTAFSPADFAAVDPLVKVHKIASYEISHIRLIELAARSGKPTVMSTGAATLDDVAWAVGHYHRSGGKDLCLMQCTAKYPAPLDTLRLATIPELQRMFGVSVGLSDHSREAVVGPLAATAIGARVIEKHFTLDNRLPGPDHPFALNSRRTSRPRCGGTGGIRGARTWRQGGARRRDGTRGLCATRIAGDRRNQTGRYSDRRPEHRNPASRKADERHSSAKSSAHRRQARRSRNSARAGYPRRGLGEAVKTACAVSKPAYFASAI